MTTLIIGGSSSGKSVYAEQVLYEIIDVKNRYYLATMQVYDEDGRNKVEKHKKLRQGKGFLTIEQPRNIEQAVVKMKMEENAVLLECISNLTANEMFVEKIFSEEEVIKKIIKGISNLQTKAKHLVIVTNNVFEDGVSYDESTLKYLRALSKINQELAKKSDKIVEVVAGLLVEIKGER